MNAIPLHTAHAALLLALLSSPPGPHEDLGVGKRHRIPWGETGWTSEVVRPKRPFNEVLPSWNLDVPKGAGVDVEIQVGDPDGWSPWLHIGDWGELPASKRRVRCKRGKVAIDIFRSDKLLDRARFRMLASRKTPHDVEDHSKDPRKWARLRRLHVCFSNTQEGIQARPPSRKPKKEPLTVPPIRQGTGPKKIASLICSPTSVTMVLQRFGRKVTLPEVAAGMLDPTHKLYGNWNRAVQYAWTKGVKGYLTRIADWDRVLEHTEGGRPLIISLAWKRGELRNCAFSSSTGHLIVILGLTPDGKKVICADPGAGPKQKVRRLYYREDLDKAWIARGGYCYVLGQ